MDKIVVTAFLIIAGVVSALGVFNAIYPMIGQTGDAFVSMQGRIDERMKSQVEIIYAAKSGSDVLLWAKNVGALRVAAVDASDLFFGPEGNFSRIPYGSGTPHWEYVIENASEWTPTATARITIIGYAPLTAGQRYFAKIVLPNGVADDIFFSW